VNTRRDYTRLGKTLAAAATLSVLLLFVAVPRSQADDRERCQRNTEQVEHRFWDASRTYGGNSDQAKYQWRQLKAARQYCWNKYHAWYGARDQRWHNERDWDRYDQERDRSHDKDWDRDRDHDWNRSHVKERDRDWDHDHH